MLTEQHQQLQDTESPLWWPQRGALPESEKECAWAATPGKIYDPAISGSRAEVHNQVMLALSPEFRPPHVSESLAAFVELTYLSGRAKGENENAIGYNEQSLQCAVANNPELKLILEKANLGRANPREIVELIGACGMSSAELARVMHVYGYRVEHLEPMFEEVYDAVRSKNGVIYPNPEAKYTITALDTAVTEKDFLSIGLAMKRTGVIGRVGNTLIKQRTTFVLNIEKASPLDQNVARYLRLLPLDNPRELTKIVIEDGRVVPELVRLLAANNFEAIVPMSTTIYACNADNLARIEAENAVERSLLILTSEAKLPEFRALRDGLSLARTALESSRQ